MFSPKLMILKGFPQKRAQRRNNRKIGVSLYACNFFICVYAHIFFYLLIHKKCHFIKHCALFVKIRGIIYINQSFTAGRNVSTLRPSLRPLRPITKKMVKRGANGVIIILQLGGIRKRESFTRCCNLSECLE